MAMIVQNLIEAIFLLDKKNEEKKKILIDDD
jgi:hypothetical protein